MIKYNKNDKQTRNSATLRLPSALLFDMDGTLTDTEKIWFSAERRVFEEYGIHWRNGDQVDIIGMALPDSMRYIVRQYELAIDPDELGECLLAEVVRIAQRDGLEWRPGACELLAASARWGIPSALVTSSYRVFARLAVEQAPPGTLTVQVTGDMVAHGKPDPEPYQYAARLLGVDISTSVAFEDSSYGVLSAYRSGAHTVAIPFQTPLPDLPGVTVIHSLTEVDKTMLASFMYR